MEIPTDLLFYVKWSGIVAVVSLIITIISFLLRWGVRFRFVGITAFMGVVTASIFALKIAFLNHVDIPGSVRYTLVYDNAANQAVIAIPPQPMTTSQVKATLRQAAYNLFSSGRLSYGDAQLTVRIRTVLHPQTGVSEPYYLGQIKRSLLQKEDENMEVEVFEDNLGRLANS